MANKINISDFIFQFQGRGAYKVTYVSPVTRRKWTYRTTDMPLIDRTKNSYEPLIKDLEMLKRFCKNT